MILTLYALCFMLYAVCSADDPVDVEGGLVGWIDDVVDR